jgi:hypothetical protein
VDAKIVADSQVHRSDYNVCVSALSTHCVRVLTTATDGSVAAAKQTHRPETRDSETDRPTHQLGKAALRVSESCEETRVSKKNDVKKPQEQNKLEREW